MGEYIYEKIDRIVDLNKIYSRITVSKDCGASMSIKIIRKYIIIFTQFKLITHFDYVTVTFGLCVALNIF